MSDPSGSRPTSWQGSGGWRLALSATGFELSDGTARQAFEGAELSGLAISRWWFGRSLLIAGTPVRKLPGLTGPAARTLREAIERQRVRAEAAGHLAQALEFRNRFYDLLDRSHSTGRWIAYDAVTAVLAGRPAGGSTLPTRVMQALTPEETAAVAFVDADHRRLVAEANEAIRAAELVAQRSFLARVETSPLTDEQARAVVTFDNRLRVIAAAGSGKTSVMVARAAYALQRGFVAPDRILMLAFNADAAAELQGRVDARLRALGLPAQGLRAATFHSFGRSVIGRATGRKPSIAPWVERDRDGEKISEIIDRLREESLGFRYQWDVFRLLYGRVSDEPDGGEPDSYDRTSRLTGFRTYRGETVRSEGERLLADWLFLNGVDYDYEHPYSHDVADRDHSQYRPDFFYPAVNVWHEHWALRADGTPPESFPCYAESMAWKRQIHQQHGTTLVETTWAEIIDLSGFDTLAGQLESHGLELDWNPDRPVPGAAPIEHERLARLVRTFLSHVKSSSLTRPDLDARLQSRSRSPRSRLFLDIFWQIHDRWEQELSRAGAIDFDDMLIQAAEHLERDPSLATYDLVLVDEFQDSSRARARLTRALVQGSDKYLLAVGDDWQAINRFAGADLSLMTQFHSYFGPSQTQWLQTTFRCPQVIADVASRFVSANPAQLTKTVVSANRRPGYGVRIVRVLHREALAGAIEQHLEQLAASGTQRSTVDILGRYRFQENLVPRRRFAGLDVTFRTAHGSKGLEADHIILPNLTTGTHGFPSQIADDPVLDLALSQQDGFPHSEERRLFYVALTRARLGVTIFTVAGFESPFVVELLQYPEVELVGSSALAATVRVCPGCGEGTLVVRTGQYGRFLGCSRFPRCRRTERI